MIVSYENLERNYFEGLIFSFFLGYLDNFEYKEDIVIYNLLIDENGDIIVNLIGIKIRIRKELWVYEIID